MYSNLTKRASRSIVLTALFMAVSCCVYAQDLKLSDSIFAEVADTLNPDPEWYVAPMSLDSFIARHPAPRRAAANCPIDSVQIFNVDSVLTGVEVYEYGDTTRILTWTVNSDGTRFGTSRTEEGTNGNITFSASYTWDFDANDWKGTAKEEYTFVSGKETVHTSYDWLNGAWSANTRDTRVYDAAGRETEYTTYVRNANGALAYSKQILREYNTAGKLMLDINYTAHNGTDWSAGTKRVYDYDGSNKVLDESYTLSNGAWVGSSRETWTYTSGKKTYYEKQTWSNGDWANFSKEVWEYNGPSAKQTYYEKNTWSNGAWIGSSKELWVFSGNNQTLHEKYGWANSDWAITLREIKGYDDANNNNLVENYSFNANTGVATGTKKEEYTYNSAKKKTETIKYTWVAASADWRENTKLVNDYDAAGNTTETANYIWNDGKWKGTGNRTLKTYNSSKKVTEEISQTWSADAADWVNYTRKTTEYEGSKTTQEATYAWQDDDWVGTSRSDWHYNTAGKNDTIKTYTYVGTEWIYSDRTAKTYNAAGSEIMVHNAHWNAENSKWVMTSMTRVDILDHTVAGIRQTLNASWKCNADSVWIGVSKDTASYSATNKPLYRAVYDSWANNDWVPYFRIEYKYDELDRKILEQRFDWNVNAWKGNYCNEYGYDEQGRQTLSASYTGWDKTTETWIGSSKTEQTYGDNNKVASSVLSVWGTDSWRDVFRYNYIYDAIGREIEQTVEHYENNVWVYTDKHINEYIGNSQIKDNSYIWQNNLWVFSSRHETYFDDDAQAKLRREVTGLWNNGTLLSFTDNHYFYACDPKLAFTIRFVNENGTELQSKQVQDGAMPAYSGETPTKESTAEWSYTFAGWDKTIVAATADATYTATFTATKNTYLITFMNGETVLQSGQVAYGETPVYNGEMPAKDGNEQYTYTFVGWDAEPASVTGEAIYHAVFSSTANTYLITFMNGETVLQSGQVAYGETPVYNGEMPTKDGNEQYSYTFKGWDAELAAVSGAATYNAVFDATVNTYLITFMNGETVLQSGQVAYGETPVYNGETPTKDGNEQYTYSFKGWNAELAAVTGAATYNAVFDATVNTYLITFMNGEAVLQSGQVAYGETPVYNGETPTKDGNEQYTYSFKGWDVEPASVTGAATYNAVFDATVNTYLITFMNGDVTLQSGQVAYGTVPTYDGETPAKDGNEQYTYSFKGWDAELAAVTGAATYNAVFDATVNTYLITFMNGDVTLQSGQVAYGTVPTYDGETPTKDGNEQYTYSFKGWDAELAAVTGAATYNAVFDATVNTYLITFMNGDVTLQSGQVAYGTVPTYDGETPTKDGNEQYTYSFKGWDAELAAVTGAATYNAVFDATVNTYLITFMNGETVLQSGQVAYGETPVYNGETPAKDGNEQYTYTFVGWDAEPASVTGEAIYHAVFSSTVNTYLITFKNGETVLQSGQVAYDETPVYNGETPTKDGNEQYTYTFVGWDAEPASVTGEAIYHAVFDATVNTYLITFMNGETVLQSGQVAYGETPAYNGETPTKQGDAQYSYTFAGWDSEPAPVTGEATYTATFSRNINTYTVTFYLDGGTIVLESGEWEYGATPSTTATPSKDDEEHYYYTFAGWTPEIVPVTGDASYTPIFKREPKQYTITFNNYNGKTLWSTTVPYGEMPEYNGETPSRPRTQQYTYEFAGWSPELGTVSGDATYTAVFDEILNQYTVVFLNEDGTVLDSLLVDYGTLPEYNGETPTKEPDENYKYEFAGWTPRIVAVSKDATYTATYTRHDIHEGIDNVQPPYMEAQKVMINGILYILRGDNVYTTDGVLVE